MAKVSKNSKTSEMADSIISFDTFKEIGMYDKSKLQTKEPSCFNGCVRIRKYRVTIEPIEEENEVLAERLQKLWDECKTHHNWRPLRNAASEIGYELKGDPGSMYKN